MEKIKTRADVRREAFYNIGEKVIAGVDEQIALIEKVLEMSHVNLELSEELPTLQLTE